MSPQEQKPIILPSASHSTNAAHSSPTPAEEEDAMEAIMPLIPIVLPLAGAALIFLLAFIAVYLA